MNQEKQASMQNKIFFASLLHDIGKFWQRADSRLLKEILKDNTHLENVANLICPENEPGKWGYQHVFWTHQFFKENEGVFNAILENGKPSFKVNVYEGRNDDNLVNLSIFHHKPQTKMQAMVQLADWWSSGMERNEKNAESKDDIKYGTFKYKKVGLSSIFDSIAIDKSEQNKRANHFYSLTKLGIEDTCFPKVNPDSDLSKIDKKAFEEDYNKLWNDFVSEFAKIPTDNETVFIETLLALLKKYTWCIPASTNDLSNVSLFEHLKTTAAIAASMLSYEEANPDSFHWELGISRPGFKSDHLPLMLVCWDISGIQKFIYNITSRKAAVSLKGRSFYLQLLMDAVIQKTIKACGINSGHVIYGSGGKLFMLMANTAQNKEELRKIHQEIENDLWEKHQGGLYLCLGITPFLFDIGEKKVVLADKCKYDMSALWKKAAESAGENKGKKYYQKLNTEFDSFFTPQGEIIEGEDFDICAVSGIEGFRKNKRQPSENSSNHLVAIDKDNEIYVTKAVKKQVELGENLKGAKNIFTYVTPDNKGNSFIKNRIFEFETTPGIYHYLMDDTDLSSADHVQIKGINQTSFHDLTALKGKNSSYGFIFYGGNQQALTHDGENKAFEDLAGKTFLGVLRMDVDFLGQIFIKGLPENSRSFAHYATLSSSLDWFFSGYLNTIRNSEEFKDDVNILYSGGDDVFAVGKWNKLIEFAEKIRTEFERFTGREDISISGGISMIGPKFPIRKAADLAGEAEEAAKKYAKTGQVKPSKNAFNFFGETVNWKEEYPEVKNLKDEFVKRLSTDNENTKGKLSKALLQQLMQWKIIKDSHYKKEGSNKDLSYIWHTAYYIARYRDKFKNEDPLNNHDFLEKLKKGLFSGEAQFMVCNNKPKFGAERYYDLAALAARWAEMELKENV